MCRKRCGQSLCAQLRRSAQALVERQAAFELCGLDSNMLDPGKATMHVVNLAEPCFDINKRAYDEMRQSVTYIMHR
ncbi:hypothetical protein PYCCODRAFT_1437061 [Trametes coccinea BRFM310]|uniref:Uncharacterized protein n=1 Tax=Trametes coccinea (strain BRFM310) TaxID=1353009 RepID=A0A1Y2IHZ8_TRAC3|nr:hypothetical protein PYCCODRAFT_1437061 [Trametes coccinea BRFM310]